MTDAIKAEPADAPPLRRRLLVIGIGAGDPNQLTLQAIEALNRADVFFVPIKGSEAGDLARIRREVCARFIREPRYRMVDYAMPRRARAGDYAAGVDDWHQAIAARFADLLASEMTDETTGAFLVWGDPSLYDSTLRILARLEARGRFALDIEVIPGISAPQALAARHGMALNAIGEPLVVTPGRWLAEHSPHGAAGALADAADGIVVMLDVAVALGAADPELLLYWGANLGLPDEVLISGRLGTVLDEVTECRAALREKNGWVFETALLRKKGAG